MTEPVIIDELLINSINREANLLAKIEAFQTNDYITELCQAYVELSLLYLMQGDIEKLLSVLEQLDAQLIKYPNDHFLIFVYYVRAELAFLYKEWAHLLDFCEKGISIAMCNQNYLYIAQFYRMFHQWALLTKQYEQSCMYCKLALYYAKKSEPIYTSLIERCQLGLMLVHYLHNKPKEAKKILLQNRYPSENDPLTKSIQQLQFLVANYFDTASFGHLKEVLSEIWALKQYNLVNYVLNFFEKHVQAGSLPFEYEHYLKAYTMDESVVQHFEKFAYHDQIRALTITKGRYEEIGYTSGELYRQQLQQQIDAALPEQFITIVTFVIKVNDPELLSRHLKVQYEYYVKIDRDLKSIYPQSTSGKYYPSSFCALFITNESMDLHKLGETCQRYLDTIDLELENQKIHYSFRAGASSRQKQHLNTLHELYQQAAQSLYYAIVSQRDIVIFGK